MNYLSRAVSSGFMVVSVLKLEFHSNDTRRNKRNKASNDHLTVRPSTGLLIYLIYIYGRV